MSIINSVYDYISTCDFLKSCNDYVTLYVDYSKDDEVTTYSINSIPCNPVLKTYVTGDTVNQYLFTLESVENYSSDKNINSANIAFYEQFSKWIRQNNKNGILPIMEDGQTANKIECITGGYMFANSASGTTSRYVIQCKLTYDQEN
jgi:hypothetical protein